MKFRLQIEVIGDNSVAWCKHSGVIEGEDAMETRKLLNEISAHTQFSFPMLNGEMVILNEDVLKRAIFTIDEITD